MKYLFLILVSFNCFAGGFAPIEKQGFDVKTYPKFHEFKHECEEIEGVACYDIAACPIEECELVDNEVLDYIKKVDAVSCEKLVKPEVIEGEEALPFNEFQDCDDKFETLVCKDKQEKIKNFDLLQVYCVEIVTRIDGKKLVNSEVKKAALEKKLKDEKDAELAKIEKLKALKLAIKADIKDATTVAKLRALVEKLIEVNE